MLEQITLLYQFLQAQPPVHYVRLVSWHLLAVLAVLGVLSAFGLHFLIGHLFRFYRRKERLARWVSVPTLLVLLASVQLLLAAYLLSVQAPALVRSNLSGGVTPQLGHLVLEPAFASATLAAHGADDVPKAAIKAALRASSELEYRNRLRELLGGLPDGTVARGGDVLVQMGLRWVTAPHNTWFAPLRSGQGQPLAEQGDEPFFLPDFLASLIDELPEGTVLPRQDWEFVAGTRFVEGVLRPLVEEYLSYLALALVVLVLLVDALYFLLMRRLKRIGQPKPAKAAKPGKAPPPKATPPAVVKGSAPDTTPTAKPAADKPADKTDGKPAAAADAGAKPADAPPEGKDTPAKDAEPAPEKAPTDGEQPAAPSADNDAAKETAGTPAKPAPADAPAAKPAEPPPAKPSGWRRWLGAR